MLHQCFGKLYIVLQNHNCNLIDFFHLNNLYGSRVFSGNTEGELEFSLHAYGDGPSTNFDYAGYTFKSIFDLITAGDPHNMNCVISFATENMSQTNLIHQGRRKKDDVWDFFYVQLL